ncbi:hypothetical protein A3842_00270 [Paenibacillus sp. P3E]|uniref:hypothetical protein n=1 Tax=Paenibacillus sp. P3E TaxID=1349435 RepID=UPI00093C5E0C|nr:hypothetical protein [Paenibacillus sp. P3E]OKP93118.1 hypothetical protein A3842_00270 [Paenibacillus sp. P3E]
MKKAFKLALVCTFLLNISFASAVMANPVEADRKDFKEVKTSGVEKARVGEWKGDDTVVIDSLGNESTVGELREAASFVPTIEGDSIQDKLLAPEQKAPKLGPEAVSSAYGHAWPYYAINSKDINCYAYAVDFPYAMNPGFGDSVENWTDSGYFTNVFYTAGLVVQDGNTNPANFKSP